MKQLHCVLKFDCRPHRPTKLSMNPTRGVVRIASRLASASRQAIRTPPVVPPIVRRISVVSNRSNVPEKFQGVPILRHHAIANRAPTVPYFDPAATNLRNLTVITTPHLNDEGPYRKHKPKRILLSGRNRTGIEKRRTVRMFSTSSSPSKKPEANGTSTAKSAKTTTLKTNGRLTWRDATKSPMKALRYSNQLWKDFIHWCKHMWAGMKLLAVCFSPTPPDVGVWRASF